MSIFDSVMRALVAVVAMISLVVVYMLLVAGVGGIAPVFGNGGLTWDNSAMIAREAEYTARVLARQQGETIRWTQTTAMLRQVALWAAIAGVFIVAAIQAGRTVRHVATERRRERQILLQFASHMFPAGSNVRIEAVGWQRQLMVRNYDTGDQWPAEAAHAALASRRLLVDGEAPRG